MAKDAKPAEEGTAEAPPKKSKKLLIIILSVVLVLVLAGGGAAFMLLSGSHADEDADEEYAEESVKSKKAKKKAAPAAPPVFINLEPFTVNLVPETGDQYLQVVLSLELESPEADMALKALMPRIRNNITLLLSSKKASELLPKEGKEQLAKSLKGEINSVVEGDASADAEDGPVKSVLFTSFIIQ